MRSIEITENALKLIQMALATYKGRQFVNLGVYYQDDSGECEPTKWGLTLSMEVRAGFAGAI